MKEIQAFKTYLESERNLSAHTVESYLLDIKQFFNYSQKQVGEILTDDILNFIVELRNNKYKTSTSNRKLSAIKTFFKFMIRQQFLKSNPADIIEGGKLEQRLPSPIDANDIENIIKRAETIRDKAILEVLYGTGVRRSELVNLKVEDINFKQGWIKVLGKGGKERIIPLNPTALKLLKELTKNQQSQWVFPGRTLDKHLSTRQLNNIIKKIAEAAGVNNITPHKFRHSFCSILFENGADIKTIQDMAGHASVNTTNLYTKIAINRNIKEYMKYHPRGGKINEEYNKFIRISKKIQRRASKISARNKREF